MSIVLIALALLFGLPLLMLALLIFLPVRVGLAGQYREDGRAAQGWVRPFAGLMGVVFDFSVDGGAFRFVLGPWTVWRSKQADPQDVADAPSGNRRKTADARPGPDEVVREPVRADRISDIRPGAGDVPDGDVKDTDAPLDAQGQGKGIEPEAVHRQSDADRDAPDDVRQEAGPGDIDSEDAPRPSLLARWRALKAQIDRYRSYWTDVRPVLGRFFWRLLRSVRFQNLEVEVAFGTGDPALTGQIFGYVQAIRPLLGRRTRLWVTPDFMGMRLEGAGRLTGSIYLYRTLWSMACLAVRGGWIGFWIWRAERRARRASALREV